MCGICVIVSLRRQAPSNANGDRPQEDNKEERLAKSLELIAHRGPDARGIWVDPTSTVALGHCRLSIIDLSPSGDQPLHDDAGHIHAVINGEIYDHERLRAECVAAGYTFKGNSDSETAVALYQRYGAPTFLEHCRGEFSMVIYDDRTGEIFAVRDRFGIKPLYWTIKGGEMFFASEMKAFLPLGWKPEWDTDAIALRTSNVGTSTIFKGVQRVEPGQYMTVARDGSIAHKKYWDLDYCDKRTVDHRSPEEMVSLVREELVNAIRLRLRADVPVGVYLSGGLDSSMVAGIIKHLIDTEGATMGSQERNERITTLTIEFDSKDKDSVYNESAIASRTAKWLGVREVTVNANEKLLAEQFETAIWFGEQEVHQLSFVAKIELSKRARESGVKVILTGEGADENFAGYPWYLPDLLLEPDSSRPEGPLNQDPKLLAELRDKAWTQFRDLWGDLYEPELGTLESQISPETQRRMNHLRAPLAFDFETGQKVLAPALRAKYNINDRLQAILGTFDEEVQAKIQNNLYIGAKDLLANTIIPLNADRTEMANSLEGRPPILDHKLAELVSGLPPSAKLAYFPAGAGLASGRSTFKPSAADAAQARFREKWEIYARPKHGFTAPTRYAAGGPMHALFSRLLARDRVEALGFLDADVVERAMGQAFGEEGRAAEFAGCVLAASYGFAPEKPMPPAGRFGKFPEPPPAPVPPPPGPVGGGGGGGGFPSSYPWPTSSGDRFFCICLRLYESIWTLGYCSEGPVDLFL
ncbi:Amidase chyE [Apiospora hydei]|uniref:Amidase chyE n=1 Tax=Apiospora hydei TaxID=1337664 RepID=A0ABR1XDZ1_9PEZI